MRRSRRKGQLRRTCSILARSHSAIRVSSAVALARAIISPNGSATNESPQNSSSPSTPTRLTAATKTPLAIAWLHPLPRVHLFGTDFFRLAMPPSDGRRIEKDLRTGHRGEPRGFGEPLIPAYEGADRSVRRGMRDEIEIAGGEIEFLVVARVVGDVHLAVAADDFSGLVDDGGGVVIDAGRATLEDRRDDYYFSRFGDGAERFGGRAGNWLGEIEKFR